MEPAARQDLKELELRLDDTLGLNDGGSGPALVKLL